MRTVEAERNQATTIIQARSVLHWSSDSGGRQVNKLGRSAGDSTFRIHRWIKYRQKRNHGWFLGHIAAYCLYQCKWCYVLHVIETERSGQIAGQRGGSPDRKREVPRQRERLHSRSEGGFARNSKAWIEATAGAWQAAVPRGRVKTTNVACDTACTEPAQAEKVTTHVYHGREHVARKLQNTLGAKLWPGTS